MANEVQQPEHEVVENQPTPETEEASRENEEAAPPEAAPGAKPEEPGEAEPEIQKAEFEKFQSPGVNGISEQKIEMLLDVVLPVTVELGRSRMFIKEILELERGTIIELDKMAGEPVDLYINNKKMAEGEVVVVDKHFGVRITNLLNPDDRIKSLGNMT